MLIFYIIFCFIAFLCLLTWKRRFDFPTQHLFYAIISIILIFFAGLRSNVPDYDEYVKMFANPWELSADKGFALIITVAINIISSPVFVFVIVSFLSVLINFNSFKRYSADFWVAVLFYFVHSFILKEYIIIRVGLASAICLYSVRYMVTGQKWRYYLCVFTALTMHLSSIVFIPSMILYNYFSKRSYAYLGMFFGLCLLIGVVYPFGQIIKSIAYLFGVDSRLMIYANWEELSGSMGIFTNMATLKQMMLVAFMYYFRKPLESFPYFKPLFILYVLSTCWLFVFNDFSIIGGRMATFLSVGEPILMSMLLYLFTQNSRLLVKVAMVVVALLIFVLNLRTKGLGVYELAPLI